MAKLDPEKRDAFEQFVAEIDFLLEDLWTLLQQSPKYRALEPGFSDATLEGVEAFYLDVLAGNEKVSTSKARLDRIVLAYLGEGLIERVGGKWALDEDDESSSFGTPIIVDWADDAIPWSPVEARERLTVTREPFLRDMIDYASNKDEIERQLFE